MTEKEASKRVNIAMSAAMWSIMIFFAFFQTSGDPNRFHDKDGIDVFIFAFATSVALTTVFILRWRRTYAPLLRVDQERNWTTGDPDLDALRATLKKYLPEDQFYRGILVLNPQNLPDAFALLANKGFGWIAMEIPRASTAVAIAVEIKNRQDAEAFENVFEELFRMKIADMALNTEDEFI